VPKAQGFPTLVVGTANQSEGTVELRTFDHVDALHRQRWKRGVALDRVQYDTFVGMAQNFLGVMRVRVSIAGPPLPSSPPMAAPRAGGSNTLLFVALGAVAFVFLLAAAAVAFWALRMRH
jgi:hypothetical protein